MPTIHHLTAEGLRKLQEEFQRKTGPEREALAIRLRQAIQQGDLSENADYIQAKEEQAFLEGRIEELKDILHNYEVIDEHRTNRTRVDVGAKVTIRFEEDGSEETYMIVGPKEANPSQKRISHESPIGAALMNHEAGTRVTAITPEGKEDFTILAIN